LKDFFKSLRFKILVGVVALLLGLIIYEASSGGYSSAPNNVLSTILWPFQKASSSISGGVSNVFDKFIHADEYEAENEQLKNEVAELQKQLAQAQSATIENEQLKTMLGIKEQHEDFDLVNVSVIGRDQNSLYGSFTIDKGSLAGITPDCPVITENGLVGKVVEVSLTTCRVQTMLSPEFGIAAYVPRTLEVGPVSGIDNDLIALSYLAHGTAVKPADIVMSSGSAGVFPAGINIGVVTELQAESNGITTRAVIKPSVDVRSIKSCFIIKNFAGKAES